MDLTYTEEQLMLKKSIAEFIRREAPPDRLARLYQQENGYDADLYQQMAEPGWLGMLVPEEYGGIDVSLADCTAAFEEFGRGPLPGPLFTSSVLGSSILLEGGSAEQKERLLPAMVEGRTRLALAAVDSGLGWGPDLVETRFSRSADGWVLDGRKKFVHDAEPADVLVCAARDAEDGGRLTLFLVDRQAPGVSVTRHTGLLTAISEVRLDSVPVPRDAVLGEIGQGWSILERAVAKALPALCAFKVGACQQVFDFTLQYTRDRFAFGQAIGRFQRVQDHVVELANHLDGARWITNELVWKIETGLPVGAAIHEAKAVASEAYYQACNYSHMVHAGPGTVLDHPLMSHTLVSRTLYQYLGDPSYHKRRMMDVLYPLDGPAAARSTR